MCGALAILDTASHPEVVSVVEFIQIPPEVPLTNVVVHAADSALQDPEVALCGIHVDVAANVFMARMSHGVMPPAILATDAFVAWKFGSARRQCDFDAYAARDRRQPPRRDPEACLDGGDDHDR